MKRDGNIKSFKRGMGTKCVDIGDRDERARRWLRQRSEEGREMVDHRWSFSRQYMVKGAPQSWTEACFAGFAEPVQTKQIFEAEKHDEDRECAKYTSCLTMATDVQFATGVAPTGLVSGNRRHLVCWWRRLSPSNALWHHVKEHCEQRQVFEQSYTEQVWDLAHVGVRAMRRVMAIENLQYPMLTSLANIGWRPRQRGAASSVKAELADWSLLAVEVHRLTRRICEGL